LLKAEKSTRCSAKWSFVQYKCLQNPIGTEFTNTTTFFTVMTVYTVFIA